MSSASSDLRPRVALRLVASFWYDTIRGGRRDKRQVRAKGDSPSAGQKRQGNDDHDDVKFRDRRSQHKAQSTLSQHVCRYRRKCKRGRDHQVHAGKPAAEQGHRSEGKTGSVFFLAYTASACFIAHRLCAHTRLSPPACAFLNTGVLRGTRHRPANCRPRQRVSRQRAVRAAHEAPRHHCQWQARRHGARELLESGGVAKDEGADRLRTVRGRVSSRLV